MHKASYRYLVFFFALLLLVILLNPLEMPAIPDMPTFFNLDPGRLDELTDEEIRAGYYYRLIDEDGLTITRTGRRVRPGDRYLDRDNRLYEAYRVKEYTAWMRYIHTVDLLGDRPSPSLENNAAFFPVQSAQEAEEAVNELIAIYHTHNAESYEPTDGTHSIYGRGGIHEVGRSFKEAMEGKGIDVLHDETFHLPHDRGAYRRSRSTVTRLLGKNPDVMFDIHRDAAPPEAYAEQVDGEWITQIQFVVGQQNHNFAANRRFAYDLKGYADEMYPGLIKGIFKASGNYNQDLTPLNLLLEVGAHTNSRPPAEEAAALFSEVVAFYFYGPEAIADAELRREIEARDIYRAAVPPAQLRDPGGLNLTIFGSILTILFLVAAGGLGFFFLNNPGGWPELRKTARDLPRQARLFFAGAPENLRRSIRVLPEEVPVLGRNLKQWVAELPGRFRSNWNYAAGNITRSFAELGREAPLLRRHLARFLRELPGRACSAWRDAAGNISRSFSELPVDASVLWEKLRRWFARQRNR